MSERPLLDALAELAREQQQLEREDPELAAWQKGQLSTKQGEAIEQRIDPRDAELFRPVSAEKKAELARKVREQLEGAQPTQANVVSLFSRRWPWFTAIAASVMVVAIGGRYFIGSSSHSELPRYALSISSGALAERNDPASLSAAPTFAPNTTLQLILRPEREITGGVAFRAFFVRDDRWIPWSPPFTMDASGSIVIEGQTADLLDVEPGPWTIVFVLAHPDIVADVANEVARGRRESAIVLEQKIVVAE